MKKVLLALLIVMPFSARAEPTEDQQKYAFSAALAVAFSAECGLGDTIASFKYVINLEDLKNTGLNEKEADSLITHFTEQLAVATAQGFDVCSEFKESLDSLKSLEK